MAREELKKSRAEIRAAMTPFLPSVVASLYGERYMSVHRTTLGPIFIGSTLVGGQPSAYNNYASLGVNWNIYDGGKDLAGLRAAQADTASAQSSVIHRTARVLVRVVDAYIAVAKAQSEAASAAAGVPLWNEIARDAQRRDLGQQGTLLAVETARIEGAEARRRQIGACVDLLKRSIALAQLLDLGVGVRTLVVPTGEIPTAPALPATPYLMAARVRVDPGVLAAQKALVAARQRLRQARSAYRPTLALIARYDALGSAQNYDGAVDQTRGSDYEIGLVLQQTLYPFDTPEANVDRASADEGEARIRYRSAMIDTRNRIAKVLSRLTEARLAQRMTEHSAREARGVMRLTESLARQGRGNRDAVAGARIEANREQEAARQARLSLRQAAWNAYATLEPGAFVRLLIGAPSDRRAPSGLPDGRNDLPRTGR